MSCALAAGCDGGGSPTPTPPPAVNQPPAITSGTTASVAENVTGTAFQVVAADPEGRALTYTLSGADAARFAISASGALSFVAAPDFETPNDADTNNVYLVTVNVSDGQATTASALTITVTNVADQPFAQLVLQTTGTSVDQSLSHVVGIPGSTDLFLVGQDGSIFRQDPAQTTRGPLFMKVPDIIRDNGVRAMLPAADFATSGAFYVSVVSSAGDLEVRRYTSAGGTGNVASGDVIVRVPFTLAPPGVFYPGGSIVFGPDGYLYVLTGAGGDGAAAQSPTNLLGKVLRVDLGGDAFPADAARDYRIPADNPTIGGQVSEVFALGLANPAGASFEGNNLLFGDGGQAPGEIDLLRPQDKGANYGYGATVTTGLTAPVIATDFNVVGGYVYRGPVAALTGAYIFGGGANGVSRVPASQIAQGTTIAANVPLTDLTPLWTQWGRVAVSFAEDSQRNLYFLTQPLRPGTTANLYRVEAR